MDLPDLTKLVSGSEPAHLRTWLAAVESSQLMTEGSVTPVLGTAWRQQRGLWTPGRGPEPLDHVAVYLVLSDYVPGAASNAARALVEDIVRTVPRDEMLVTLAALNCVEADRDMSAELARIFAAALQPDIRERFEAVTDTRLDSPRRFLSRQGVLAAMKAALQATPQEAERSGVPLPVAAVLLVHACSMLQEKKTGGDRHTLMMEVVRNVDFNLPRDPVARLSDHAEMWEMYGDRLVSHLGLSAGELLQRVTGLEVGDFIAYAFAVGHRTIGYKPGAPLVVDPDLPGMSRAAEDLSVFLTAVAATADELAESYDSLRDSPWNFVPFQRRPVLRLTHGKLVVLDQRMLFERVTDGLYWDVHDALRDTQGESARGAWTRGYGSMVEGFVVSRFASLAPAGLSGPTHYSEDDLKRAYPKRKVSDGVLDFGAVFVPIEVVSGRLTVDSRVYGNVARFRRDTEKIVMKKARQLDAVSKALLHDEKPLTGRSNVIGRRIQPMLVTGGGYPVEPLSSNYIREEAEREQLFQDSRVLPLAIISLDELSMLVGLAERGHAPDELLAGWRASGIGSLALRAWLLQRFPQGGEAFWPARTQQIWDELEEDTVTRLGLEVAPNDR